MKRPHASGICDCCDAPECPKCGGDPADCECRYVTGPDGTVYRVIPNEADDGDDYGWLEPVEGPR